MPAPEWHSGGRFFLPPAPTPGVISMGASSFLASFYFVSGIVMFFLAVTIVRQTGRSAVSWFTALVLFFASFGPLLGAVGYLLQINPREGTLLLSNLTASFAYVWEFFFPSLVLFALVFPRRHRAWHFMRRFVWMLFLPHVFHLVLLIFLIGRVSPARMFRGIAGIPVSVGAASAFFQQIARMLSVFMDLLFRAHVQLFSLVNVAYAGFSLLILVNAARSDVPPRVKRQVWILVGGLGLCIVTFSLARLLDVLAWFPGHEDASTAFINAALVIGGGSIAYAIVRHQFLGLRVIARRGILYVAAAALIATAYLVVIRQITAFFSRFSGGRVEFLETGFIILFIVAFQPVLARVEEWSERFVARERRDPRSRMRALSGELLTMIDEKVMRERVGAELRDVFETDEAELVIVRDVLAEYQGDPGARQAVDVLCNAGEPMMRADLLESLGVSVPRGGFMKRGARRELGAIIEGLPPGTRRLARYDLLVPVMHDVECVAAILLGSRREHDRYNSEEIALVSMLASQVASSLHNIDLLKEVVEKRVMEEELNIARSIQQNLLPSTPPLLDSYEIAALSESSKQVGGDYYDFLHREKYLAIAVADVAGKGVPASLLMASLQATLRSNMDRMERPIDLVSKLNRMMGEAMAEDKFATLFYGCLDMDRNVLGYTNAGHVFPCFIRTNGRLEVLEYSGLILGVIPDFQYELQSLAFEVGDTLVITSDGVTEASNVEGEFYGEKHLHNLVSALRGRNAADVRDAIVDDVKKFTGPKGAGDDLTILVLRRKK
jgi:serine phosphatase RsbU (regulator of sigma subunit)